MERRNGPPKRALSQPEWAAAILWFFATWFINGTTGSLYSNMADAGFLFFLLASPVVVPLVFVCAYYVGLVIAKVCYSKGLEKAAGINTTVGINLMVLLIFAVFSMLFGARQACFDTCQTVPVGEAIISSTIVTAIAYFASYFGVLKYYSWVKKYNLPRPVIKQGMFASPFGQADDGVDHGDEMAWPIDPPEEQNPEE